MKIDVLIHQDKEFMDKVKDLVIKAANEVVKDNAGLKELLDNVAKVYLDRVTEQIPALVRNAIDNEVKRAKFRLDPKDYRTEVNLDVYIKHMLDKVIREMLEGKIGSILKQFSA